VLLLLLGSDKKKVTESVLHFINGLKFAKDIYVECPSCQYLFSLFDCRLMYGKSPPRDLIAKSVKQVKMAQANLDNLKEKFDDHIESSRTEYDDEVEVWRTKVDDLKQNWRYKLDEQYSDFLHKERTLKEKIRHMKQDVAATNKEIIKEKTKKAVLSSRSAIEGHIAELFPIFKKTRLNPADLCSLIPTQPVDFVVFNGLFQKNVNSVTFLDVKKGKSRLSPVQQQIRDSIHDGHVDFKKMRVNFDSIKGEAHIES